MERATPNPQVTEAESPALDWNQIYSDLAPRVYNYFRYRLGQEGDVENLTSRTFEKAWIAREQYRRDLAGFSTWLFKIAQNPIVDHVRSQRHQVSIDQAVNVAENGITENNLERNENRMSVGHNGLTEIRQTTVWFRRVTVAEKPAETFPAAKDAINQCPALSG